MFADLLLREADIEKEKLLENEQMSTNDKASSRLCCSACGQNVTETCYAIEINEKHQHTFTNPADIQFVIRCF
ncbi:MAG: hypothetical protein AAF410_00745 [Pseudomonadota bacterium]